MAAFASRYARALADVVGDQKLDHAKVTDELNSFTRLLAESADLRNVWENPSVPPDQKIKLLDAIVKREGGALKPVRNFIAVLIQHRRIGAIHEISEEFRREMDTRMGFAEAEVSSARPLNAEERRALESQIAVLTKKQVRAVYAQDAALIGGAVVKIGSTIYDGSVRGQLERIKEQIAAQ